MFRIEELIPQHSILRLKNKPGCAKEPNSTLDRFGPAVGLLVRSSLNTKSPPRLLADDVHIATTQNSDSAFHSAFPPLRSGHNSQLGQDRETDGREAQLPLNSPKSHQPITNNGCSKRSKRQDTGEAGVKGWRSAEPHICSPAAETRKAE